MEVNNYSSALLAHADVESQILAEIAEGNYKIVHDKPFIVSALGAIPKSSGGIRLIHDASQPQGQAINDFAVNESQIRYQSVADAIQLITPQSYMARLDLKAAYRSVSVKESHHQYTGLKWRFTGHDQDTYLVDTKLPFGARLSVEAFHRLSRAIQRILHKRGISVIIYLDDILIVAPSHQACQSAMQQAISILRELGFAIAYNKLEGPMQQLTFLGIFISAVTQTLHLPSGKVAELLQLLRIFRCKKRASLKQLQRLAGKLAWAANVVRGGRIYLQRVYDIMRPLKHSKHKVRLNPEFYADMEFWLQHLHHFNCRSFAYDSRMDISLVTDACTVGGGATLGDFQWCYWNWQYDFPHLCESHINILETMCAVLSIYRWAPLLHHRKVILYTDNTTTKSVFSKGRCNNQYIMAHMRILFWLSNYYEFDIECHYLPGKFNVYSDSISRLHSPGHFLFWYSCITHGAPFSPWNFAYHAASHMSNASLHGFLSQVPMLAPSWLT